MAVCNGLFQVFGYFDSSANTATCAGLQCSVGKGSGSLRTEGPKDPSSIQPLQSHWWSSGDEFKATAQINSNSFPLAFMLLGGSFDWHYDDK